MSKNEQRVAALEAQFTVGDQTWRIVFAEPGESHDQVLDRLCIDRDDERIILVTFR